MIKTPLGLNQRRMINDLKQSTTCTNVCTVFCCVGESHRDLAQAPNIECKRQ